jgi:DNA-binding NtrC family response regulator
MQNLTGLLTDQHINHSKTVVISGAKGSGRKTLAQYLQKRSPQLAQYEVVESSELTFIEEQKIYICHDLHDVTPDKDILVIQMPTLAERRDDLIALSEFYVQVHALIMGKNKVIVSEKAKEKIQAYAWPGQFPELERVLEKAVQSCEKNVIEPEDIILEDADSEMHFSVGQKLENIERQYILQTLFFAQQNRTKAAEILGISIRTLRNKLNQYRKEGYL